MAATGLLLHFIHTREFDDSIRDVGLPDETLSRMQGALCENPRHGIVIKGTGGLRKMRLGSGHRGKRGGLRVIYHFDQRRLTVYLLLAYEKGTSDDLSDAGKKHLGRLVWTLEADA